MSSVYPIFGQKFFLAWSFVISNSKLGPAHVRRTFAPFYIHFCTSFFAHNLHANLPLSVERPTSSTAPSFPHLGCACLFLFPARLQAATWPSFWPSSRAPAHSSSHLFARFFFFLPPAASLFIFYAPLTTFARFTFPVSGGGSDVFESLIVVACLFATPPPPLSCCPLQPPRPACPAAPAARFVV